MRRVYVSPGVVLLRNLAGTHRAWIDKATVMDNVRWRCFNCKNVSAGPLTRCEECGYMVAEAVDDNGNILTQAFLAPEAEVEPPNGRLPKLPWPVWAVLGMALLYLAALMLFIVRV